MLIDLIAAKPEDADAILATPGHANVWSTLESNGVDRVKLASLALLLKGQAPGEAAVAALDTAFERLIDGGTEGPWIDRLPDSLVDDLAHLTDTQIEPLATAWARTEQAQRDRWDATEVADYLRELAAFAASAHAQHQAVLMWSCL